MKSGIVKDPVTCSPDNTVADLRALCNKSQYTGFPVVEGGKLVGLITNRDYRFCHDDTAFVKDLMTTKDKLIVGGAGRSAQRHHGYISTASHWKSCR